LIKIAIKNDDISYTKNNLSPLLTDEEIKKQVDNMIRDKNFKLLNKTFLKTH